MENLDEAGYEMRVGRGTVRRGVPDFFRDGTPATISQCVASPSRSIVSELAFQAQSARGGRRKWEWVSLDFASLCDDQENSN